MSINSVSFGKKYLGTAPVRNNKTGEREMLNFVEYDSKKDVLSLSKTANIWNKKRGGNFIELIALGLNFSLTNTRKRTHNYGIEDDKGEIQAVCKTETKNYTDKKGTACEIEYIAYFEVSPDNACNSFERKYAKVGTSLFSEIVKIAKKKGLHHVYLTDMSGGFWEKMPFIQKAKNPDEDMAIYSKNYDECLKKLDEMI